MDKLFNLYFYGYLMKESQHIIHETYKDHYAREYWKNSLGLIVLGILLIIFGTVGIFSSYINIGLILIIVGFILFFLGKWGSKKANTYSKKMRDAPVQRISFG